MNSCLQKFVRNISVLLAVATVSIASAGPGKVESKNCSDPRLTYTPKSDVQFIDFFQPHHMMALEMADEVIARGESAELKVMAKEMKRMQAEEIQTLRSAKKAITGKSDSPHFMDHHMMMDMKNMKMLSGRELDIHFIDHMIAHHASALPVAHQALPYLKRTDIKDLAKMMISTQAQEIGELQKMRE